VDFDISYNRVNVAAERNSHRRNGEELMLTTSYDTYRESGGISDPARFHRLLLIANTDVLQLNICIAQIAEIALAAKIELNGAGILSDETVAVYKILRMNAIADAGAANPHRTLSDEQILAETLLIVGDFESLEKLSHTFPYMLSLGKK